MESRRRLPLALLWIILEFVDALYAQTDVLVDDVDPRINFTGGNWTKVDHCQECGAGLDISRVQGGSYHMVHSSNQRAEFQFTGIAISVYGVVPAQHSRERRPPNVSFTIDGSETTMNSTNGERGGPVYNTTLFLAENLPDRPHTLFIQTHDDTLFILDYLTYTTNATARTVTAVAAANASETDSTISSSSTFPYDQSATSSPTGAQPAVVGGVIGGIFGAFLIAGIIGLWFIRRSNRRRGKRKAGPSGRTPQQRPPFDRKDLSPALFGGGGKRKVESGSSSGVGSGRRDRDRRDDQKKKKKQKGMGVPVEYAYSGPKPVVGGGVGTMPLTTTRRMEALSAAANDGTGGGYRSPLSTFASTASSSGHGEEGKIIHALTTDTPQEAQPAPLYVHGQPRAQWSEQTRRPNTADAMRAARQWEEAKRPNTADPSRNPGARPFSSGSTLEVDGVLERVMQNHSNAGAQGYGGSRDVETPRLPAVYFSDHPFRTTSS